MFRSVAIKAIFSIAAFASSVSALEFRITASGLDKDRHSYELELMELALFKADGDHTLTLVDPGSSNQTRLLAQLAAGSEEFDVIFSGVSKERYESLTIVPIPLQRGLLGHRILISNEDSLPALQTVETFEDLKKIRIGSGTGWPDTEILESAGLNVSAAAYENLFTMTDKGRVQGYARGVAEPFAEVTKRSESHPNLRVDSSLMIVYPFDTFFFTGPEDQERADIILQGLERAYEDGSFMAHFNSHPNIQSVFEQAQIDNRLRFDIPNPLLPEEISNLPDHLWHGR